MSASTVAPTSRTFMLPDLGEGLTEAEVVQWHVAAGDEVRVDQIVVTVETAKASVDLPCPYAGRVLALDGAAGAVLQVGKPLLTIGTASNSGAASNSTAVSSSSAASSSGSAEGSSGSAEGSGSGSVLVGYGTSEAKRSGRRRVTPAVRPTSVTPTARPTSADSRSVLAAEANPGPIVCTRPTPDLAPKVISPVVRKLARDHGIDLAAVAPTGAGQVIRRADVESALRVGEVGGHSSVVTPTGAALHADRAGDIRIPLRGVRGAMAEKMTISRREIPEATTWVDVDATALLAARDEIKAADGAAGIGVLALLARISIAGLRKFPELNAWVDLEAQEIVQRGDINLSFAAQSPRGLVVPVVHGAGEMTTTQLAVALRELTGLAREGRLTPAQLTGGTFTLNNYGVFGTDGATPIINYPEAAMLGVGRIMDRPWAHEGQVALRKVGQLGLTFDHRVCDGAAAGGFLRLVADCMERPSLLLALL